MSKIKLDERIENAMNAFFKNEPDHGLLVTNSGVRDVLIVSAEPAFSGKFDKWSNLLRELFLFGPGTFFLYYVTLLVTALYPTQGFSIQGLIALTATTFITYAGVGDIRKTKNLAVPATVITVAAAVAIIRSVFPVPVHLSPYFSYTFYLFPVALIAAKLMKMWISEKE